VWRILFASVFAWSALTAPASGADVTGAGATFPYPLYATWAAAYKAKTGILVNYQSIGSGGGIKQIQAKTIDFGATDVPLTADELDRAGLLQFPMVMGGIVPVINLRGIPDGALRLDGATLAGIFLGETAIWHDLFVHRLSFEGEFGLQGPDRARGRGGVAGRPRRQRQ